MRKVIFLWIILSMFLGCKNSVDSSDKNQKVILNKDVVVLSEKDEPFIDYISDKRDTMIINLSPQILENLKVGKILVGKKDLGFALKIEEIQLKGNKIILKTRPAALTEIFKRCIFDTTFHISPTEVQKIETLRKGVQTGNPLGDLFTVEIDDVILYDLDGNEYTTYDQLKANGTYTFGIDLDFKFTIDDFKLTYLKFASTISQTGRLELFQNISLLDFEDKIDLVKYQLSPITVMIAVGPVPVPIVIVPVIRFEVGAEAKFDVEVSTTIVREEKFTSGVKFNYGMWQTISNTDNKFGYEPPSLSASGLLKGYAGPQIDLMLYGIVGPYMLIDPYLELDADINANPWWVLLGGLEAGVGVHLEVLDQTFADVFFPKVIDIKDTLATAVSSPPEDNNHPQMLLYYPFNSNAHDESGHGYNGFVHGATLVKDRFGSENSAYHFNGNGQYIMTNVNDAFDDQQKGSVSFWIKPEAFPNDVQATIFSYSTNSTPNSIYSFVLRNNGKLEIIYKYNGILTPEIISNTSLELNQWYHVVFVADGENRIKFYLNNQEISTYFLDNGTSADGSEWFADLAYVKDYPHFITVGASVRKNHPAHAFFTGIIDDIRVFNYPLSTQEIDDLYHENGWTGESNFPSHSLIGYYPFNGNANDESGFNNHGTVHEAKLTNDRFGNSNSAYQFDGVDDYIEIPDNVVNNLPQGTFSAWFKLDELNRQHALIDKTETYNINYLQIIVHSNNRLRVNINVAYGESLRLYSNTVFTKDTWYHVSVTWDGSYWKIYVNGQLDAQAPRDRGVPTGSRRLFIGIVDGGRSPLKGTIDDIRIYNYVLTDQEINTLYHEKGW